MPKVEVPPRLKIPAPPEAAGSAPRPKRRRWLRALMLLSVVVALLPTGLSIFGGVPVLIKKSWPQLAEIVQFRTISLHWWAPVELNGVVVRDVRETVARQPKEQSTKTDRTSNSSADSAEAEPLITIRTVRTVEPLWQIVVGLGRGMTVVVVEPHLNLVVDEQGSNLQSTMTELVGSSSGSSDSTFPIRIRIEGGDAVLTSEIDSLSGTVVSELNAEIATLDPSRLFPELRLAAEISKPSRNTTKNRRTGREPFAGRSSSQSRLTANLNDVASDFPVVPLEPFPADINESATTDDSGDTARFLIEILPSARDSKRQTLRLAARQLDLRLIQPAIALHASGIVCEGLVSCDLEAELAGPRIVDGIVGRLRLAGEEIRLRQSEWAAGEWLSLGTTEASGAIAIAEDGILLNKLNLTSAILEAEGSGELRSRLSNGATGNHLDLHGTLNLARLTAGLPKTLGLHDDVQLTKGNVTFRVKGETAAAHESSAHAATESSVNSEITRWQATVSNDQIEAVRAGQPWVLDSTYRIDAVGPLSHGLPELAQARLSGDFGAIDCAPDRSGFLIAGTVNPVLLWRQLSQFIDLPAPGIHGELTFRARALTTTDTIQLTELQIRSDDLTVSSDAFRIHHQNPPPAMLDGTLHVDGTGSAIRTLIAPWHSATWLAEQSRVVMDLKADPVAQLHLRVGIQPRHLQAATDTAVRSISHPKVVPPEQFAQTTGAISHTSPHSAFQLDEALVDFQLSTDGRGSVYQIQNGLLQLPGIVSAVSGTVTAVASDMELDLTADTQYDLAVLCTRMLSTDSPVRLDGQGRDVFRITGSPSVPDDVTATRFPSTSGNRIPPKNAAPDLTPLRITGGLSWQSGRLWGLTLGDGSLQAELRNGIVVTEPILCALNAGKLNVMPQYDLIRNRLQLATGSRVENVNLTPDLCREWLGYVAPVMAEATNVNGMISARVEKFDYDLNTVENSTIVGMITIHNAQASPGSSLQSLLEILDVVRLAGNPGRGSMTHSLVMPAQDIPFQLKRGAVHHQGLMMDLAGYRAQSQGSVGLNRELQLALEIPLEKSASVNSPRTIRVPIGGTIDRPLPDTSALVQGLGAQALQKQFGDRLNLDKLNGDPLNGQQLNEQVDKQLNKLFNKLR